MDPENDAVEQVRETASQAPTMNQTLLWGGTLILLAGITALLFAVTRAFTASFVATALFCAACIFFAIGMRGGGSVVGHSIWGRVGLIGAGVIPIAAQAVAVLGGLDGLDRVGLMVVLVLNVAAGACAIVAVASIIRQRALPGQWRLVPLCAVAVVEVTNLLAQGSASGTQTLDLTTRTTIARMATALIWVAYGVLALAFARKAGRLEPAPRPVVDPAEANLTRRS